MKLRMTPALFLALGALLVAGCSKQGPDVVDPNAVQRRQTALFAINAGTDGELARYSEEGGLVSAAEYADNNGGERSAPIDAIYEHGDSLYLHHRSTGEISLLNLRTRKKMASIAGFPTGPGIGLNGMAFSNQSQAWVICQGVPTLYLVDAFYHTIAGTITLPGNPTSVATDSSFIFVGMQMADGSGQVGLLRSNPAGPYAIEKTYTFPTPVVYMTRSRDGLTVYLLTAGSASAKPGLYAIDITSLNVTGNIDIDAPSLAPYIGMQPTFAAISRNDFIYVGFPSSVLQIDGPMLTVAEWLPGNYPILDIDPGTDLLYAVAQGSTTVKRLTYDGLQLDDLSIPSTINAIRFVSSTTLATP